MQTLVALLALAVLVCVGCKKSNLDSCGANLKACVGQTNCYAEFSCPNDKVFKLVCRAGLAARSGEKIECDCVENGAIVKKVQVPAAEWTPSDAREAASSACGWPR
jgi:hypothetical protein